LTFKSCLEDVVIVDDAVENVEDGVDADGESCRTIAGTELREADQRTEHYRRLIERLLYLPVLPAVSSCFGVVSYTRSSNLEALIERLNPTTGTPEVDTKSKL